MEIDKEHILARFLAHNQKATRTKAIKSLRAVLAKPRDEEIEEVRLDYIWKGLFYCMWLTDKMDVQQELGDAIGGLVHACCGAQLKLAFVAAFFDIMAREWSGIDHHRLDKFMYMVRAVLRETIAWLRNEQWRTELCEAVARLLFAGPLRPLLDATVVAPVGLKYFVLEALPAEIYKATNGKLPSSALNSLLGAPLRLCAQSTSKAVREKVYELVFVPLLGEWRRTESAAARMEALAASDDIVDQQRAHGFIDMDDKSLSAFILAMAKDPSNTLDSSRKMLYRIRELIETAEPQVGNAEAAAQTNEETDDAEESEETDTKRAPVDAFKETMTTSSDTVMTNKKKKKRVKEVKVKKKKKKSGGAGLTKEDVGSTRSSVPTQSEASGSAAIESTSATDTPTPPPRRPRRAAAPTMEVLAAARKAEEERQARREAFNEALRLRQLQAEADGKQEEAKLEARLNRKRQAAQTSASAATDDADDDVGQRPAKRMRRSVSFTARSELKRYRVRDPPVNVSKAPSKKVKHPRPAEESMPFFQRLFLR